MRNNRLCIAAISAMVCFSSIAQKSPSANDGPLVYVDKQGILKWTATNKEAAFFGVNYTVPFAYGYRSVKSLGIDLEKEIDADVYHLSRIGVDAFRVHVWDIEITDSLGNLFENDHLRLYDYLLYKLEQRGIKIILTPIAFWGNGYPERDEKTPGFSSVYGKDKSLVNELAIKAQENYLQQLLKHVNPYTKRTYTQDQQVIAVEVNNEPHPSGPKEKATEYINRMVSAIKSTGWNKPVFYNISESPFYSDAVAKSNIDGCSFQWYPSGLVANHTQKGNFLPNVDRYIFPFDSIPQFANKARMVYEFDAADILQSCMYPAIARSFRGAGFQWATQFAYDPMATAYANTEYQTHYLNLAYTPSKAISLLIASKAFHQLPRLKSYGIYPADSSFDVFRVSYREQLSEMNSDEEFYYSNSTSTQPKNTSTLKHIAGVGSSPVVMYKGSGAYFIDKLENGVWRLELMPDAIHIRDPFERASLQKEVTRIQWQSQSMQILLTDLGDDFTLKALNDGNSYTATASGSNFQIQPGAYLLIRKGKESSNWKATSESVYIHLNEFVAPKPFSNEPYVVHEPNFEHSSGKAFTIQTKITDVEAADKVTLAINKLNGPSRSIVMERVSTFDYYAQVPAELAAPGVLSYRIIIQKNNGDYYSFPGNHKGNPFAWDYYYNDTWQTFVANDKSNLEILNASKDRNLLLYPAFRRNTETQYIGGESSGQLALHMGVTTELQGDHTIGFQYYFGDKLKGRVSELSSFSKVVVRVRTTSPQPIKAKLSLITSDASPYASYFTLDNNYRDIEIPLSKLQPDSSLLLPRPYPGFLPLWFKTGKTNFSVTDIEKMEFTIGSDILPSELAKAYNFEIEWIRLSK